MIVVERVLQLFKLGRFDERFGGRFLRFRQIVRLGLRFFVLGFGQLFGERAHFIVGKARAVVDMGFRCFRDITFRLRLAILIGQFRDGNPRRRNKRRLSARFFDRGSSDWFLESLSHRFRRGKSRIRVRGVDGSVGRGKERIGQARPGG